MDPAIAQHYGLAESEPLHEGEDVAVMPLVETFEEEVKPTNPKSLTPKMASVGIGGTSSATIIVWLKARFDLDITVEDVAVVLPLITLVAGYFTKEIRQRLK
jgi:hypothetical protein